MKKGIVLHKKSLNFGDDIQSLAALRLVGKPDFIFDRERLNTEITHEPVKLLCNGWFMENPINWPPAQNIKPLFISMHITHNNKAIEGMLDRKFINYYKKSEPIGCRDFHTVGLFEKLGIRAYYSGCLTLTLENRNRQKERNEEILFVDAFNKNLPLKLRELYFQQLVPTSIQNKVSFIYHSHKNSKLSDQERYTHAEELIDRYSKAHLVVTSRIHCALPCIALGTPVLFLDVGFNRKNSRNRFSGIIENFNTLNNKSFPFSGNGLFSLAARKLGAYHYFFNGKPIKFDWDNPPLNPVDIKPLAQKLRNSVRSFLSD